MSDLGDRMKANYEDRGRYALLRRTPVIVRVDGRAFHSWTRGLERPFDQWIIDTMVMAAKEAASDMQGCKAVYIQSDEASFLLTDFDKLNTEAWFDYNKAKVESISASLMSVWFNYWWPDGKKPITQKPAMFDSRAFNIPLAEVANYFVWRMKDWERNSVSMYCHAHFSHKEMHGQGRADQHEMLHGKGLNWAKDLPSQIRNGSWLVRGAEGKYDLLTEVLPNWQEVNAMIAPLLVSSE